ncbi:MAG: carbohydrate-binding family 9-like protein [Candidatus Zixiibacteriota bacterium]
MKCNGGRALITIICAFTIIIGFAIQSLSADPLPVPKIPYAPRQYVCYQTAETLTIDGRLDEDSWQKATPTELFVDIEGHLKPAPRFETRAYMLWDSAYFYVAAKMVEPHIWAKLTERDAVIYHDNDFEVFIDPDGDTHEYYELEMNAFNTVWDLLLIKPYRDGAPAVNAWDIQGLKTAVSITGTVNNPSDKDSEWSVEIAIPWKVLSECAHRPSPPRDGDQWRVNFSRVEWRMDIKNGQYEKTIDPATGKSFPEDNWVWSPQGLIAMHYPEMWGIVQFAKAEVGTEEVAFVEDIHEPIRWGLRQIYYAETDYRSEHGAYTSDWEELKLDVSIKGCTWPPKIEASTNQFEAYTECEDGRTIFSITQEGRLLQRQQ